MKKQTTRVVILAIILLTILWYNSTGSLGFPTPTSFKNGSDRLVIETTKMAGFGPFKWGVSPIRNSVIDSTREMFSSLPDMAGIPTGLSDMYIDFIDLDIVQDFYQSYKAGQISHAYYYHMVTAWKADTSGLSDNMLKVQVPVVLGKDEENNTILIVDQNNNFDFGDDKRRVLPPITDRDNFWEGIGDSSLIEVEYEYFDGHSTHQLHSWIFVSNYPARPLEEQPDWFRRNPWLYCYAHADYSEGNFTYAGKNYKVAVERKGSGFRINPLLILSTGEGEVLTDGRVTINDYITLGDQNYVFDGISLDGKNVTLVRDQVFVKKNPDVITQNTQIGVKAKNFSAKTLDDQDIQLSNYLGSHVYLDFWGTWCGPCRYEIPTLKKVHELYGPKGFHIIGIAKDKAEALSKYVSDEQILWPQILQDKDQSLIKLYNVFSYPTTYLIDPAGTIIARNLRGESLETKLAEIYQ